MGELDDAACLRVKVDKLQECLEELIMEMESGSPRRSSSFGSPVSSRSPSLKARAKDDSAASPSFLPAAAQLHIAALNSQLQQKEAVILTLQGRVASLEAASNNNSVLLSPSTAQYTLSPPNSSFAIKAPPSARKRGDSCSISAYSQGRQSGTRKVRTPTNRSMSSASRRGAGADNVERVKSSVERTIARVSTVLKQVDEAEKRWKGRREPAGLCTALEQEQRTLQSALSELEASRNFFCLDPEDTAATKLQTKRRKDTRGLSPRVSATRKPQKAPVPPISIAELRMKTPRPASPKYLSQVGMKAKQGSKTYRVPGSARRSHPSTPTTRTLSNHLHTGRLNNA